MREFHGVMFATERTLVPASLKQHGIFFDKLILLGLQNPLPEDLDYPPHIRADLEYLSSRGFVTPAPLKGLMELDRFGSGLNERYRDGFVVENRDHLVRRKVLTLDASIADVVPIYEKTFPRLSPTTDTNNAMRTEATMRLGLQALPVPNENCSWPEILDFKAEMHDKQWAFRRFLKDVATKRQTEAEIRDDIEWTLNEYRNAMKIHRLKTSHSFIDVFVITPLEIIENLVKINWSKIAKGVLSAKKRKVELLEAEMKAPGKECAYVFDAQKRFGKP